MKHELHQPNRYPGNPVLVPDKSWEGGLIGYGSTYYDANKKLFQLWYLACGLDLQTRVNGIPIRDSSFICYAVSKDGIHWDKPSLGLYEYDGSTQNNIIIGDKESHFDGPSVIYQPNNPSQKKHYLMILFQRRWKQQKYFTLHNKKTTKPGHYLFHSPDGIHWEKLYDQPIFLDRVAGDRSIFTLDTRRRKYIGYLKFSGRLLNRTRWLQRRYRYSESDDFIHWTKPKLALRTDKDDPENTQIYGMCGVSYESIYLGLAEIFKVKQGTVHIELICSRNGIHWNRYPTREPFLPLGKPGNWDDSMVFLQNTPFVRVNNELWIYYRGSNRLHWELNKPGKGDAIGLATLRYDGFCSVAPADSRKEAQLVTVPLQFKSKTLFVNADASHGEILVEICNHEGAPIPMFSRQNAIQIKTKTTRHRVEWKTNPVLPQNETCHLRLYISNAHLYSFWVE